jgi:hypothetical protein
MLSVERLLVLNLFASGKAVLEAIIVLDVFVIELLLIFVKIADSFGLLCDGGSLGGRLGERFLERPPSARSSGSPMASFRPCSAFACAILAFSWSIWLIH